jgi:hypothetical protein
MYKYFKEAYMLKAMLFCILVVNLSMAKGISYDVPQGVRDVVKETLSGQGFLYGFDDDLGKQEIGFDSLTKLIDIRAGEPIPKYIIIINDTVSETTSLSSIAKQTSEWLVPLLEKNICVSILEIGLRDGKWQTVGIGGHEEGAKCLQRIRTAWPNDKFIVVDIPAIQYNCFHIPRLGDNNLTPTNKHFPFNVIGKNEDTLYTSLTDVKMAIKKINNTIRKK